MEGLWSLTKLAVFKLKKILGIFSSNKCLYKCEKYSSFLEDAFYCLFYRTDCVFWDVSVVIWRWVDLWIIKLCNCRVEQPFGKSERKWSLHLTHLYNEIPYLQLINEVLLRFIKIFHCLSGHFNIDICARNAFDMA